MPTIFNTQYKFLLVNRDTITLTAAAPSGIIWQISLALVILARLVQCCQRQLFGQNYYKIQTYIQITNFEMCIAFAVVTLSHNTVFIKYLDLNDFLCYCNVIILKT